MLTPWFSSINTWNGTSIDSTDCIYILIVLYLYIQHDGYICPSIGINKFKRWKRQWKASPVFFLRFHPLSPYSSAFRQSGEIDERQWSYSGIYYTLFIKKEVSYTVFRYQMIQNRAEIKQTFGAVALFVNRNHLVSSGTFYTYYTHARVCEKNMQCTYCTFCTRRAVHYFFCGG